MTQKAALAEGGFLVRFIYLGLLEPTLTQIPWTLTVTLDKRRRDSIPTIHCVVSKIGTVSSSELRVYVHNTGLQCVTSATGLAVIDEDEGDVPAIPDAPFIEAF